MRLNNFKIFYAPNDASGGSPFNIAAPIGNGSDKDDIIDFLGKDDDPADEESDVTPPAPKTKEKETPKPKEKENEETDENQEDEENLKLEELDEEELNEELEKLSTEDDEEEPSEEDLELVTPVRRAEILKKYPNLFKEFPYLQKAYYREQQFTALLPTIEDAKEAVEAKQTLDKFETALMGGDISTVLSSVREEDKNSFYKIVDDLLPTLAQIDEPAYHHLIANTTKHTVMAMLAEAKESSNDALQAAAHIMYQFVFGKSKWEPPTKLAKDANVKPEENERENALKQKEQDFARKQFEHARGEINTGVNNVVKGLIDANIDPRESMTDYVKKTAIRQVTEELGELVAQDTRFRQIVDKFWKQGFEKGFTPELQKTIRKAYISKAKTVLPSLIKKARIEALKGMGKRVRETNDERPNVKDRNKERPRSERSGNEEKKGVPRGMTTLQFLSQD